MVIVAPYRHWLHRAHPASHHILEHIRVVGFGGFDDAVEHCAGIRTVRSLAEQPVLPADDERFYRALCRVIVTGEVTIECLSNQLLPLV